MRKQLVLAAALGTNAHGGNADACYRRCGN